MALNRRIIAWLIVLAGVLVVAAGAWLIYRPAGLIVAGAGVAAIGLLAVDVDGERR
jgi:hypothetical protein